MGEEAVAHATVPSPRRVVIYASPTSTAGPREMIVEDANSKCHVMCAVKGQCEHIHNSTGRFS